jgi:transcriptional regulator with XRE-family HTH domain
MIGERLLDLRKDAGLTQDDLSEILHVNQHSISAYERDKNEPPDDVKIRIATYFGVSIDYLLGVTDDPNPRRKAHHVIRLPAALPAGAMDDLKDYIRYLVQKYRKD